MRLLLALLQCELSLHCPSGSFNLLRLEGGEILIKDCRLGLMISIVAGDWRAKVPNYHLTPLLFTGANECVVGGARSHSRFTGSRIVAFRRWCYIRKQLKAKMPRGLRKTTTTTRTASRSFV